VKLFRRVISAALVVGLAVGLSATGAGASGRAPSLSSLIVPPPQGFHSNRVDTTDHVPTGAVSFDRAVSACNGAAEAPYRSRWLGSELQFYTSTGVRGSLTVCVTRLSSATIAATIQSENASTDAWMKKEYVGRVGRGRVMPLIVQGIPYAAGIVYSHHGYASSDWISFARGPYVVFVVGAGAARTLVPSLARHEYAVLPGRSVRGSTPPLITITKCGQRGTPC
jgi:hypothetical protein